MTLLDRSTSRRTRSSRRHDGIGCDAATGVGCDAVAPTGTPLWGQSDRAYSAKNGANSEMIESTRIAAAIGLV